MLKNHIGSCIKSNKTNWIIGPELRDEHFNGFNRKLKSGFFAAFFKGSAHWSRNIQTYNYVQRNIISFGSISFTFKEQAKVVIHVWIMEAFRKVISGVPEVTINRFRRFWTNIKFKLIKNSLISNVWIRWQCSCIKTRRESSCVNSTHHFHHCMVCFCWVILEFLIGKSINIIVWINNFW